MKVVVFLPVKGSSERIANKNITPLNGKPLFLHTLEKLVTCDFIDEVYLDTENDDIYEMAKYTECKYLKRDPKFANNATDGHRLFYQAAEKVTADIYIQILGTSPFISIDTIKKGVEIIKKDRNIDSIVFVKKEKQYCWNQDILEPFYDKDNIPNSKDLEDTVIETMGLYITNKKIALEEKRRYGGKVKLVEVSSLEAMDINYPDDFVLADLIARGISQKEINHLNFIKRFINSAIISDVMDDMGLDGVITDLKCNLKDKKIFGRAKTLKIRKLKDNEDFNGIYDALNTYKYITDNDVILVENECSDYAYFGELNASLSIRAGACATIVGGVTRDKKDVCNLDYPVFSKGYNCQDVRKRATMESYNQIIEINGIEIAPSDLIFADEVGVVAIPRKYEKEILRLVLEKIQIENSVLTEIINKENPIKIVDKIGAF